MAFRRPVDERTLDRLVTIARATYQQPGKTVEQGDRPGDRWWSWRPRGSCSAWRAPSRSRRVRTVAPIDEYSLASRLSYFLWSTMPDDGTDEAGRTG